MPVILYNDPTFQLEPWNYVAPAVPAPTNLHQTAGTSSTATLAWDATAGTYTLERALVTSGTVGTYNPVYTGTAKTYQDSGLAYQATYAYRVLVMVNGVASPYSTVVQVTAAAPPSNVANMALFPGQSQDTGFSPNGGLPAGYYATYPKIFIWNDYSGAWENYHLGVNDQALNSSVMGPDAAFAYKWNAAHPNEELWLWKKYAGPQTGPAYGSTNGASVSVWLDGSTAIYPHAKAEWDRAMTALAALGKTPHIQTFITGIGETDSTDGNTHFKASLTRFIDAFRTDFGFASDTKILINRKNRAASMDMPVAAAQAAYVATTPNAYLVALNNLTFQPDGTHYDQDTMLRLGALDYEVAYNNASGLLDGEVMRNTSPWDVASYNILAPATSYANGTATTTGGGPFGNTGVNTLMGAAPGASAWVGYHYTKPANNFILLSLDEQPALVAGLNARFSFYIDSAAGNLTVLTGSNDQEHRLLATLGYYYTYWKDASNYVWILESADDQLYSKIFRFPNPYAGTLYAHFDLLNSGATMTEARSQHLGGTAAGGGGVPGTPASFTTASDVSYNAGTNTYTTPATDNAYGHTVMGTAPLAAAGVESIISLVFDGSHEAAILGMSPTATPFPSYQIPAGFYITSAGGGYSITFIAGTTLTNTGVGVGTGDRIGVRHAASGAVDLVRYAGAGLGWASIFNPNLSLPDGPYAALTLLGNPVAGAVDVRQS